MGQSILPMLKKIPHKVSAHRWKKAYEKNGIIGLTDSRKTESGRPLKRELTQSEVIERQEGRIKLLEEQAELLKKLEMCNIKEAAKRKRKSRYE